MHRIYAAGCFYYTSIYQVILAKDAAVKSEITFLTNVASEFKNANLQVHMFLLSKIKHLTKSYFIIFKLNKE